MTTRTFDVELRPIEAIKPYPGNPRVNDDAVDAVAASLKEFGFRQPIVVDEQGIIIVGHTRWKAARKLGLAQVPVHVATDLPPEKVKAYRIADNQTATLAEWDFELLPIELKDLQRADYDLSLLGFGEEELAHLLDGDVAEGLTDPDHVPEPPDTPVTQRGDVWVLGNHRLMCGNSGSVEDLDRLLDGATIDLVNMDPPYNVKVEPRSATAIAAGTSGAWGRDWQKIAHHQGFDQARGVVDPKKARKKMRAKDRPLENDFVTADAFDEMLLAWFGNASRVLKPGGSFYIWGGYANIGNYPAPLAAAGFYFSQGIVWDKQHPVLTRKDFMGAFEICFYGWKEGAGHNYLRVGGSRGVHGSRERIFRHPRTSLNVLERHRSMTVCSVYDLIGGVNRRFCDSWALVGAVHPAVRFRKTQPGVGRCGFGGACAAGGVTRRVSGLRYAPDRSVCG